MSETQYEGTDGPDLHIDPWNLPESLSVRRAVPDGGEISETVDVSGAAR